MHGPSGNVDDNNGGHVSQGVQGGGLPDKDSLNSLGHAPTNVTGWRGNTIDTNSSVHGIQNVLEAHDQKDSPLHATKRPGPYCGTFKGCIWNCRSLWSRRNQNTFLEALKLAEIHDFVILSETRETKTRKEYTKSALPKEYVMYSTGISARKGGVAVFIKKAFLDKFLTAEWAVIVEGRVARLTLDGPMGRLCIFAIYLDPSSVENQVKSIQCIGQATDPHAHNVLSGDFNFTEMPSDRIAKQTADLSKSEDRRQTEEWKQYVHARGFREFHQPHYSCENSHGWSRIDRVYSDLHAANLLTVQSFCNLLEHRRNLSDHSPISFGMKAKRAKKDGSIPTWVVTHDKFANEVQEELEFLSRRYQDKFRCEPDAFHQLEMLKAAIRSAAKYIRKLSADVVAETCAHKLACTIGFIRAVESGHMEEAARLQKKYPRLQFDNFPFCRTSNWYKHVKDHAVELMHSSIGGRVQELRQAKTSLPAEIYQRRKKCIARQLKRLLPAGTTNEISIIKDSTGQRFTNSADIARVLTEHWQSTFDVKPTNRHLREQWLERVRDRFKVGLDDLRPTDTDVEKVFANLHDSAAGPDGIPTGIYMHIKGMVTSIFKQLVCDIIDGTAELNEEFNFAFLCCIPKASNETDQAGVPIHAASSTRPLSIVDAANRIVAAILNTPLERCVGQRISSMQRGFVAGRQMMTNILDIDTAAQIISVKSTRGAIILFDFKAAFPSMDHSFIWETLLVAGIPLEFVSAIQMLYNNNCHKIRVGDQLYDGPTVRSGVRQGCPLSGLLFSICVDVLLLRLQDVLIKSDEIARAFADDTATVVSDYSVTLPTLALLFHEFEQISRLQLNIDKTVFIPLWPLVSERGLRNLITEVCPSWRNIKISTRGKYLGFIIGPCTKGDSWAAPLMKFSARAKQWEDTKCGLFWNTLYYNTFVVPTLEFVAQLEEITPAVLDSQICALRKLAAGPGTWISLGDLEHLGCYGIGNGFRLIEHTAKAAKLRLMSALGFSYIRHCKEQILAAQAESFRRPFGTWHARGYAKILNDNVNSLHAVGIRRERIICSQEASTTESFQKVARDLIVKDSMNYSLDERVRKNALRWHFADPLNHATRRLVRNIKVLQHRATPAVRASYLRALWNGVPTTRRMRTMRAFRTTNCVFNCTPRAEDSLEHYCRCPVLIASHVLDAHVRPIDFFFGVVKGLSEDEITAVATKLHVALRLMHFARLHGCDHDWKMMAELESRKYWTHLCP